MDKITFKMETLKSALQMIRKGCWFAKIDLKDAFYSIGINFIFRKYLKFEWQGQLYAFTCLPNGLSSASRIFTKVLKPVFAMLPKMGHSNVAYIDDSLLQSDTYDHCKQNIKDTMNLVDSVGLTVHPEKSVIIPKQCIEFVGFLLNSNEMTVKLAPRKVYKLTELATDILEAKDISIRDFAKLIGILVAAEPGVNYAPLHYKSLELEKDNELKINYGNFDSTMHILPESKQCIRWWIRNIEKAAKPISMGLMDRRIETDSSLSGYGGHDVTYNLEFSGVWSDQDKQYHINYLELKAAFLCLKYFCDKVTNEHIHLFMDNTVALKYISKMGGRKTLLNALANDIWKWCEQRNIWISGFHIPGKLNITADKLSRQKCNEDMEWAIQPDIYELISHKMGFSNIDLFAAVKNCKHARYVSYMPEKDAVAINAFSISWDYKLHYAFPPFSVIGRVIQKLCEEQAELILIAPLFPSQPWFPQLLNQISGQSFVLPKTHRVLYLPGTTKQHRLTTMRMGAFRLSGNALQVREYLYKLQTSSSSRGDRQLQSNMGLISKDGCSFVIRNKLINFTHL